MRFNHERYQIEEEKADKLLDKLKSSGFTALILAAAALLVLGLALT